MWCRTSDCVKAAEVVQVRKLELELLLPLGHSSWIKQYTRTSIVIVRTCELNGTCTVEITSIIVNEQGKAAADLSIVW